LDYKARLEKQIEELRIRMYEIYNQNPTDDELVEISQELDDLLNKFGKYKHNLPTNQE